MHAEGDNPAVVFRFDQHNASGCIEELPFKVMMRRIGFSSLIANRCAGPASGCFMSWRFIYTTWHFRLGSCNYDAASKPSGVPTHWMSVSFIGQIITGITGAYPYAGTLYRT